MITLETSLTFILGGARSGKSVEAERLIEACAGPWIYVATAQAFDDEMRERIAHHRARRGPGWVTADAPYDLVATLKSAPDGAPVLVDCLTLWLSNHMLAEHDLVAETEALAAELARPRGPWVVVSNEVGMGIVPDNALARCFRDEAGRLNQRVAAIAERVLFMAAGLPMRLKG